MKRIKIELEDRVWAESYVEARGTYDGCKVVICCRPEYRNKEEVIEEIVDSFVGDTCENPADNPRGKESLYTK